MTTENTHQTAEDKKTLVEQAQSAIGGAVESTVSAVKEHPYAAAGIAAGAAAAVAGAVLGAGKLMEGKDDKNSKAQGAKND